MIPINSSIRRLLQSALILFLVPITLAQAAYQCVTPPVTEAYLRDMDQRIEIIQKLLEQAGCSSASKVTLFGMDFYPDPPKEGEQAGLTGEVFNTGMRYLTQSVAVSINEELGLKEFFLSLTSTQDSYQLYLDVQQAQRRLEKLREQLGMTQQACAQDFKIDGLELSQYAETWYHTYRQLYFWLMLSNQAAIEEGFQEVPNVLGNSSTILNTVGSLYRQLAEERLKPEAKAKWYATAPSCSFEPTAAQRRDTDALPQNYFTCNVFYTSEYASGMTSMCQSPELNMQGLDASLDDLELSISNVGKSFGEIDQAASELRVSLNKRAGDVGDLFTKGKLDSFVRVNTNIMQAGDALRASLQEWTTPAENASWSQRFLEKTSSGKTSTGAVPQETGLRVGTPDGTIGGILGQAFQDARETEEARATVAAETNQQLLDVLNIRRQYLKEYRIMNEKEGKLKNSLDLAGKAADNISALCKKHQPRTGEECGQK